MSHEYRIALYLALAAFVGGVPLVTIPVAFEIDPSVAKALTFGGAFLFLFFLLLAARVARTAFSKQQAQELAAPTIADTSGRPEAAPLSLLAGASATLPDPEIDRIRRDVGALAELLTSYRPLDQIRDEAITRYQRIEVSDHTIWLNPSLRQLRRDFLNRCGIALAVEQFSSLTEYGDYRRELHDFAAHIEEALTSGEGSSDVNPKPDLTVRDLALRVLSLTEFTARQDQERVGRFLFQVRQQAIHGMPVWGIENGEEGDEGLEIWPHVLIPKAYWNTASINDYKFWNGFAVTKRDDGDSEPTYSDLRVSKAASDKLWPPKVA
ncbi:hypothetical protein [Dongia sedimenti]|uniref:Uncharacterized protein n=1 Tax=Dongia sedimenti TaxID=3064282 RepID=A0ABU0YSJ0_9PROT|nr:hypothetical protein [Rhodospirillaceae bacterium R-7]